MTNHRCGQRGFTLMTAAVCFTVMIGMLGLVLDLGRMYIIKNELQAYADSASVAAAFELDGTVEGIDRARATSRTGPGSTPNRYQFSTQVMPSDQISTTFSMISNGGWEENPASATGISFVRVVASGDISIYMMRLLGAPATQRMSALSVAGLARTPISGYADPFSPDAVNPADPNYGFIPDVPGDGVPPLLYTIKWVPQGLRCNMYPPGNGTAQMCPTAATPADAIAMAPAQGYCSGDYYSRYQPNVNGIAATNAEADRGYIDVGQGSGANGLAEAIANQNYDLSYVPDLSVGAEIEVVSGNRGNQVRQAMNARISLDSDTTSTTYADYTGDGRRLLRVPVNDPSTNQIIGYATFFIPTTPCGTGNNDPCCAEFVSSTATIGSTEKPVDPDGNGQDYVYSVKLFSGEN